MATRTGRVEGKVALVTGASGGIGRATAVALAAEGAQLVLGDVADLEAAAQAVFEAGDLPALTVKLDVTSRTDAEAAVARAIEQVGRLDILVNNAGVGRPAPLAEVTDELWDWIMDINLKGPFICARAAAPHLGQGSAIVNVASLAGRASSPAMACAYSASKAGLLGLTRHLAKELGPRGIRVTAVNPGVVMTSLVANNFPPEHLARTIETIPLGRPSQPEDIADVIVFLASDDARYVTGASLDANGGIFMA
jgi:NAD(P)-dependent dehydrogenase (short-subunit alcohol dehydrogenase family)